MVIFPKKAKKIFLYTLGLILSLVVTHVYTKNETPKTASNTSNLGVKQASADVPYSQGAYYSQAAYGGGGGGGGCDGAGGGAGGGCAGDGCSAGDGCGDGCAGDGCGGGDGGCDGW